MQMADDGDSDPLPVKLTVEEYVIFKRQYETTFVTGRENIDTQTEITEKTIEYVMSDDINLQLEASGLIRYILHTRPDPPFQQVIDAGLVPRFVEFLREDIPNIQYEVVKIFAIFAETSEHINVIIENGVVPELVNLLNAPDELTRTLVILTLGLIAEKSPELCALVLENQALHPLLAEFEKDDKTEHTVQIASWTLLQFCKGNPQLNFEMYYKVEAVVHQLLNTNTEEVIANACWILYCLTYAHLGKYLVITSYRVCSKLVRGILRHPSPWVILPAFETLANFVTCDIIIAMYMVDILKILPKLRLFLISEFGNNIKKAVCRTVANYCQIEFRDFKEEVVKEGIINVLANLFKASNDGIKTGAAWAISNITCITTPQDIKNVSKACIKPLCDMLDSSDREVGFNCLRGLDKILEIWQEELTDGISENVFSYIEMIEDVGGLQKMVNLRDHGHGVVSQYARIVLQKFWLDII